MHADLTLDELKEEYQSVGSALEAAEAERGLGKPGRKPAHIIDLQHRVRTLESAIATAQQQGPQPQQPAQGQQQVQRSRGGRLLKPQNFDIGSLSNDEGEAAVNEPGGTSDSESSLVSSSTTSSASSDLDEAGPSKVGVGRNGKQAAS